MTKGAGCDDNPHFKGERYIKNNDMGVILIYDSAGFIAGIQIGFPKNYSPNPNNYPYAELINAPFVLDNGNYFLTAYFVNPATICHGRTANQFQHDGTGTGLWIQNGTNPVTDCIEAPRRQSDADNSMWTKGSCFITMGVHYWYNLRKDMSCNEFFPVFLLYNGGVLNAFGWALSINLADMTNRIENPPQSSYGNFMNPPPDCLYNLGTLSTLHIYMTDRATADTC